MKKEKYLIYLIFVIKKHTNILHLCWAMLTVLCRMSRCRETSVKNRY